MAGVLEWRQTLHDDATIFFLKRGAIPPPPAAVLAARHGIAQQIVALSFAGFAFATKSLWWCGFTMEKPEMNFQVLNERNAPSP